MSKLKKEGTFVLWLLAVNDTHSETGAQLLWRIMTFSP